jgi:hypothetical protein
VKITLRLILGKSNAVRWIEVTQDWAQWRAPGLGFCYYTDRQAGRWIDGHTDRQADREASGLVARWIGTGGKPATQTVLFIYLF